MSMLFKIRMACIASIMAFSGNAISQTADVTFINENGFLVNCNQGKVLIDGTIDVKENITALLSKGASPFDDIDLILTTHSHFDHINIKNLFNNLKSNKNCMTISTPEVTDLLKADNLYTDEFEKRITRIQAERYKSIDTVINDINLKVLNIDHFPGRGDPMNYGYIIDFGGLSLFHCGDASGENYDEFKAVWSETDSIDMAFINLEFLTGKGISILKNIIKPRYLFVTHVSYGNVLSSLFNQIKDSIPAIRIQNNRFPMETIRITKSELRVTKEIINSTPTFVNQYEDQTVIYNKPFEFYIDKNIAVDYDKGDSITYSIGAMPSWLHFDNKELKFYGNPSGTGILKKYNAVITITDKNLAWGSHSLYISVTGIPTSVNENNFLTDQPFFYPNPVSEFIFFDKERKIIRFIISNVNGNIVHSEENQNGLSEISLNRLSPGMYYIRVTDTEGQIHFQKLIKE